MTEEVKTTSITIPEIDMEYVSVELEEVDHIQYLSDIHLNINYGFTCCPSKKISGKVGLIISGDITTWNQMDLFDKFLFDVHKKYTWILFILGNHDYWGTTIHNAKKGFDFLTVNFPNVFFASRDKIFKVGNKIFFGDTWWTSMNNYDTTSISMWPRIMNDSVYIESASSRGTLTVEEMLIEFYSTKIKLSKIMEDHPENDFYVISHMAPSYKSIAKKYLPSDRQTFRQQEVANSMNSYYASHLDDFIIENPRIKAWFHGHVHSNFDYLIGKTRILCNPKGYNKENVLFKPTEAYLSF